MRLKIYVTVLLFILANVSVIDGLPHRRNVDRMKSRKSMDLPLNINLPEPTHPRPQENLQEGPKKTVSLRNVDVTLPKKSEHEINPTQTDLKEQMQSTTKSLERRLDPSDQTGLKMPMKLAHANYDRQGEERTTEFYRSTSEDLLRWLLKQKIQGNPAPDQIGQLPIGLMLPVTQPLWIFEDYDDRDSKSDYVKNNAKTCEAQRVRCTQDSESSVPICVNDLSIPTSVVWYARQKGFLSHCEVEYRNCLKRYELTGKYYADHYNEDYLVFAHYGWCDMCLYFSKNYC